MAAVPETALPTEACLTDDKKSELLAQVKQLSVDTLSIDSSFDSISRLLNNLAEAHIPKELVKDVERLTHIWHDLQTTYSTLLWKSRDVAGDARVAATDFAKIIIDEVLLNTNIQMTEIQEAIRDSKQKAERDKIKARDMVDGFKNLAKRIEFFCKDWEETVEHNHLYRFSLRYKYHEEEIKALSSSIRAMKIKIVSMSVAVGLIAAAAGILALIFAIDGNSEALGMAGILAVPAEVSFKGIRSRCAIKKAQVEKLDKLKAERDENQTGMQDIKNIATKLGAIVSVWGCISADLSEVEKLVATALQTEDKAVRSFRLSFSPSSMLISMRSIGVQLSSSDSS
ncbi:unnamed protein product [Somion occarium]|uniref:Uncharacterized protein n=1 Tax=Somion occarium TaxID=3059160 RepID=A0ABP1E6P9_9APHY